MTFPTSLHIRERGTVHDPDLPDVSLDTHRSPLWPQGSFHDTPKSSEEILHAILNTRKSWKTLKGQAEAVWPPYLEATMLKGAILHIVTDRFSNLFPACGSFAFPLSSARVCPRGHKGNTYSWTIPYA